MRFFKWLASCFGFGNREPMSISDQAMEAVISECWRTGKIVIGNLNDAGELEMTVCEDSDGNSPPG